MHIKTILNRIEKHGSFVYGAVTWRTTDDGEPVLEVGVRSRRNSRPACSGCGRKGTTYDHLSPRRFEFVPLWGLVVYFLYAMCRVDCPRGGVTVERVPWALGKRPVTTTYAWFLARWAKRLSWSETARAFKTSWETVFRSVGMAVAWGRAHLDLTGVTGLEFLKGGRTDIGLDEDDVEQDVLEFDAEEWLEEVSPTIHAEEIAFVEQFLADVRALPADSKLEQLQADLREVLKQRETVVVFTQYTDTMDYIRDHLRFVYGAQVACYSGRGGEIWDGSVWKRVSKEEIKRLFKRGEEVKILVGTDAMSEGLNLQTCGVLFNFDLSWNPMRVEQRIGRIDRIGQRHAVVWVRNYFYEKSVEAEVYRRLEHRIHWFEAVVGHLQPILTEVSQVIQDLSMARPDERARTLDGRIRSLDARIDEEEAAGLRLDQYVEDEIAPVDERPQPVPPDELEALFLASSWLGAKFRRDATIEGVLQLEWEGTAHRVTFRPEVFDAHPNTVKLLTYGEPLFEALLRHVPAPAVAEDDCGRVLRAETDERDLIGYYPLAEGAAAVPRLADLREQLVASATVCPAARREAVEQALRGEAALWRQRAQGVREELAVGEFLAVREEARTVLRRATFVEMALQRSADLFGEKPNGDPALPPFGGVREFARAARFPFAPLLVLLENEEIRLPPTDPYWQEVATSSEKSLRTRQQRVRDRAEDILHRLKTARDRVDSLHRPVALPNVTTILLR